MASEYGKVIVGEPVEEEEQTPLITGIPVNPEPEAVPVFYRGAPAYPPPNMYGSVGPPPPPPPPEVIYQEPGEDCALIGCLLSWIPIIGVFTYLWNLDAHPMSKRAYWAHLACCVATIVIVANIIYWVYWYEEGGCNYDSGPCD
jgi:hypothetical protein